MSDTAIFLQADFWIINCGLGYKGPGKEEVKARRNVEKMGADNVEFRPGETSPTEISETRAEIFPRWNPVVSDCPVCGEPERDGI